MMPWFNWKNRNSYAEGLWISKLPKITRAKERYQEVTIPGRAGSLMLLEGDDVYESYVKESTVICPNNRSVQKYLEWLRGSGEVIFSNEPDFVYEARIANEVEFERVGNSLLQAKVKFFVQPYKHRRHPEGDTILIATASTIYNPGNVASRPQVTVNGSSSVTIAGQTMTFGGQATDRLVVDCDAGIVLLSGEIFTGTVSGDFWRIPPGSSQVTGACTIFPRWRWV